MIFALLGFLMVMSVPVYLVLRTIWQDVLSETTEETEEMDDDLPVVMSLGGDRYLCLTDEDADWLRDMLAELEEAE